LWRIISTDELLCIYRVQFIWLLASPFHANSCNIVVDVNKPFLTIYLDIIKPSLRIDTQIEVTITCTFYDMRCCYDVPGPEWIILNGRKKGGCLRNAHPLPRIYLFIYTNEDGNFYLRVCYPHRHALAQSLNTGNSQSGATLALRPNRAMLRR